MDPSELAAMATPASTSDAESTFKRKLSVESDEMGAIQQRKTRKRIPSEQWEAKRPIITKLYQVEKRSLKEVMEILERDYGFEATVKMYKSRIWKWGLDKKLKSDEVLAILLLKHERDAQRKPSQFTIRGQPVDLDNINRYVKRNPLLLTRLRAGHQPSVQTSNEVSCFTPPPSPTRSLPPPGEFHRMDELMRLFRDYVDGSLASFAWSWQYDISCTGRLPGDRSADLFDRVMASFALVNRCLKKGDNISVNSLLSPAFESLKEIVAAESPIFIVRTVCLLWYLEQHHKNDLLRLVLDYLGKLIPIMLGQYHMLARIWQILGSTHFADYNDLSMRLYALLVPMMEHRIGPANELTTILYGDHIDCVFQRKQSSGEVLELATKYREKVDNTGQRHYWLLDLVITQTAVLCAKKESEGDIGGAMDHLQTLKYYPLSDEQEAMVDIQMGNYSFRLADNKSAIAAYRRAARLAMKPGGDERLLTTCLTNLETALAKDGWSYDAARVRDLRLRRIEWFAADTTEFASKPAPLYDQTAASFPAMTSFSEGLGGQPGNQRPGDDSWVWQETLGCGDVAKDIVAAGGNHPVDHHPGVRDLGYPVVSGAPWTEGPTACHPAMVVPSTTVTSVHYPSLSPPATTPWVTSVYR
ncbi:unnamed protein product [Clonostachys byssicola]|uniref:Clr5 domain-containing protein n=1 Tax=Clonostachys byssicola TaxID=160290 RepID=A0A9N9UL38_9HYPO|nr:unnamed protein product [Clonostachys byssicola]